MPKITIKGKTDEQIAREEGKRLKERGRITDSLYREIDTAYTRAVKKAADAELERLKTRGSVTDKLRKDINVAYTRAVKKQLAAVEELARQADREQQAAATYVAKRKAGRDALLAKRRAARSQAEENAAPDRITRAMQRADLPYPRGVGTRFVGAYGSPTRYQPGGGGPGNRGGLPAIPGGAFPGSGGKGGLPAVPGTGGFPGFGPTPGAPWGPGLAAAVAGLLAAPLVVSAAARFINLTGSFYSAATDSAKQYFDVRRRSFALGRAGGFSGQAAQEAMGAYQGAKQGGSVPAAWMRNLGVTQADLLQSLDRYGIVPTSAADVMGIGKSLAVGAATPGFSGVGAGTVEKLAGQGVGLGYASNTGEGVSKYLMEFEPVMKRAVAGGMDRSRLIESMQGSLEDIAKSGSFGGSTDAVADIFARLQSSGLTSGRTGTAAASLISGAGGFGERAGSGSIPTMAYLMDVEAAGGLGDVKKAKDYLRSKGISEKSISNIPQDMLSDMVSLYNTGQKQLAMVDLAPMLKSNPKAVIDLAIKQGTYLAGGNKALGKIAAGGSDMLGTGVSPIYGYTSGAGVTAGENKETASAWDRILGAADSTNNILSTHDKGIPLDVNRATFDVFQKNLDGAANVAGLLTDAFTKTTTALDRFNGVLDTTFTKFNDFIGVPNKTQAAHP